MSISDNLDEPTEDETETVSPELSESPSTPPDPVLSLLESRARDLSLSIINPSTLAKKLRETLIETVGPDKSTAYYIGATFDGEKVDFQISYLSPSLLVALRGNTDRDVTLGVSWQRMIGDGWKVEVGADVALSGPFSGDDNGKGHIKGIGGDIKASFSVMISK